MPCSEIQDDNRALTWKDIKISPKKGRLNVHISNRQNDVIEAIKIIHNLDISDKREVPDHASLKFISKKRMVRLASLCYQQLA